MPRIIDIALPYNFKARPYQWDFFEEMQRKKRAILVWHRRAGKEKTCWNFMIKEAFKRVGNYYYIFPDAKMARRILWDGKDKVGYKTLDHIPSDLITGINNSEMKIVLRNNSLILVLGSHDVDSLRGPNPVGIVFSEYAEQSPKAWQTMSPILKENEGWAVFNFTPKGQNHAYDLLQSGQADPKWFTQVLSVNDTTREDGRRVLTEEDIEEERAQGIMSEDMIQQEYYCSFIMGIEGSYYAKYIKEAREEERIGKVPYNRQSRVYTAWDIGYGDATSIIFYQCIGNEIHVIDFYEAQGEGLPHYAKVLSTKPYIYADHYAPHDVESHNFSTGLSAKDVGAGLGLSFHPLPTLRVSIEDGIEAVRGIFPRICFDAVKCKKLLKCLEHYRKEFDDKHNCYRTKPVHDWSSHAADAMRYMAIAVKMYVDGNKSGINDKEADRLYNLHNPIFK